MVLPWKHGAFMLLSRSFNGFSIVLPRYFNVGVACPMDPHGTYISCFLSWNHAPRGLPPRYFHGARWSHDLFYDTPFLLKYIYNSWPRLAPTP